MSDKKAILAAMLAGRKTPETERFTQVSRVADQIGGAIVVSESATKYGDRETDIKSELRSRASATSHEPVRMDEQDRFSIQGHVNPTYQPQAHNGPKVDTDPKVLAALMSGNKAALQEARRQAAPQQQQPVQYSDSPVVQAMNEAMGYPVVAGAGVQTPQPQLLNEEMIRQSVRQIIKEELDAVLLQNIFSENRMMQLYQEQFKKTLTKILEQRMAAKQAATKKK